MKFLFLFFLFLILSDFCGARTAENLKVRIDDGKIIGRYMTSISGRGIRAFLGLPYAAPPIGELRFKAAKKPTPWFQDSLLAHNEPPMCTQINIYDRTKKRVIGQEDCLYLNVYTPNINITEKNFKKLNVMVWFHGGGFVEGHSGHSLYGPEYILEHDIVLVTGNYRLGPLGFLSTEDEYCSGNFGLKDQLMMLEWVQMNIEKFGGDGNSVTIFGENAGAASVNYHMFSPMSRGLFHRAISQSGNVMDVWAEPHRQGLAKMKAIRLADKMNCPISGSTIREMVECLRNVPAEEIIASVGDFLEWDFDPLVPFGPVVESSELEEEPFIMDLNYKKFSLDIPWLLGINSEEGIFKTAGILNSLKLTNDLAQNWETIIPTSFYYDHLSEQEITEINVAIYGFYYKLGFLGEYKENLTSMWSDGWMVNGIIDNLQQRLEGNNRDNTYVYLFSHKGSISFSEILGANREKFFGTCHGDDLLYLFPIRHNTPQYYNSIPTNEDTKLRKLMTKLWVNFATTGNPTPEWSKKSKLPYWTPASKFPLDYMQIGNENGKSDKLLEMKKDLYTEHAEFWIKLREKYGLRAWKNEKKGRDEL
ncbi:unnamed protein product [Chironomus riparius]|uniref:Carboxylesterase type B domain-containing protein n=1 Tax=Chironomus riparius TaxID=315576 RepID=A0A9N9WXJ6_9DIPT|nr:unnamed protein product [Chironomus riparius]